MIKIREFKMDDFDQLVKLWISTKIPLKPKGRDKYTKIKKELKNNNSIFLIAEVEGKIIGSVFGTHDGRKGWINRLAIAPDFQGKGIAKKLCKDIEKRFYKAGIEIIGCLIEKCNIKSINFIEKIGYSRNDTILYYIKKKNKFV